jgi:hypothetical protein
LSFQVIRRAIERDPSHYLRMNEVLPPAARFPNAFVRLPPHRRQMVQYNRTQGAAAFGSRHAGLARLKHRVGNLAEDVDLQLLGCRVSNPHRKRILIAGQPRDGQFW